MRWDMTKKWVVTGRTLDEALRLEARNRLPVVVMYGNAAGVSHAADRGVVTFRGDAPYIGHTAIPVGNVVAILDGSDDVTPLWRMNP